MTAKQKLFLVAAQYAAQARLMTRESDLMMAMTEATDEARAKRVVDEFERLGLIDRDGMLTKTNDVQIMSKVSKGN